MVRLLGWPLDFDRDRWSWWPIAPNSGSQLFQGALGRSESEMKPERIIEVGHEIEWDAADSRSNSFYGHESDLFCLGLGIDVKAGLGGWEQNLERVDPSGVGGHRNNRDHASAKCLRSGVCPIVAYDHSWTGIRSFAPDHRIEVDQVNVSTPHQLSPVVTSQTAPS